MALYRRGSMGEEVKRIQRRLQEQDHYRGAIDGIYGGGTESAVRAFQRAQQLAVDGIVGPNTWGELFDEEEVAPPAILGETLSYRCLALTGSFETGKPPPDCFAGVAGDFDGQGISFGALQWNFGQGSLQPLLQTMDNQYPDLVHDIFAGRYSEFQEVLEAPREQQMAWGRSVQDQNRYVLREPWRGLFKTLGRCGEFQELQVETADRLYKEATDLAREYEFESERAVALMFDIKVQNGSIYPYVKQQIMRDFEQLPEDAGEEDRLSIVANRRSEACNPRWIEDVRRRKLAIARGQGTVHGMHYNLSEDYGIRLAAAFIS
ncbi:peptidoglycan-binding domain-containing protein [Fodinibius sediminis]|uniref:Peptidoglycan binding domain-containing protein n=1 Tax=Fodinibius sediminis TaxID=1214077 RepID=A0A521DJA8_9BACT|nr:peptidoglycan-binding domain-containing protein [Fodinibius sediminis]SMO71675.1 Putative peptidoglycan binding domain-containing protein [Fodinibius sediminis]